MSNPINFLAGFSINFFILSLMCGEAHGWGWYNYTEATVYTACLDEAVENPEGKWSDFCSIGLNFCYGIFCDEGLTPNKNLKCEYSKYMIESNDTMRGYVFFHDDSPNYTITTKSQEYLKELKTRVNRNDSSVYVREYDYNVYNIYLQYFNREWIAPYTFESNTMLFLVIDDSHNIAVIDYQCSLVYIRIKALEYVMHYSGSLNLKQRMMAIRVLTILSSISLFIVAIFYACIRELRSNIIGKLTLVLAISVANNLIAVETTNGK
jgi:hypothetical protein